MNTVNLERAQRENFWLFLVLLWIFTILGGRGRLIAFRYFYLHGAEKTIKLPISKNKPQAQGENSRLRGKL